MEISQLKKNPDEISNEIFELMKELYPICRSITGEGVRKTLKILQNHFPVVKHEIPTGTEVFDWKIPKEWNVTDAYIEDLSGQKIIDFKKTNLHLVSYSVPIKSKISNELLKKHLFSIPEQPKTIPYITSYYSENWGFCLEHEKLMKMNDEEYNVVIESKLEDGHLTYGEYYIPGKSEKEIIFSTYICHPSMCNDNLSGVVVATALAKYLKNLNLNYSIRFLFIPETIGAITWLFLNQKNVKKIKHGLVLTCIGDGGKFTYKKSRRNNSEIDETVPRILNNEKYEFNLMDFYPWGSDERQFCSPGFNLPFGTLMRSIPNRKVTKEYHTSDDNLQFMSKKSLKESFEICFSIISELEKNFEKEKEKELGKNRNESGEFYMNLNPMCEPQLGKRGLYNKFGGLPEINDIKSAIFWILNLSDGNNSLEDIERISGLEIDLIKKCVQNLEEKKLIKFYIKK